MEQQANGVQKREARPDAAYAGLITMCLAAFAVMAVALTATRLHDGTPADTAQVTPTPPDPVATNVALQYAERPCLLSAAANATAGANAAVQPQAGWKRFQDATSCFTLDYPAAWEVFAFEDEVRFTDDLGDRSVLVRKPPLNPEVDRVRSRADYDTLLADGMVEVRAGLVAEADWTAFEGVLPTDNFVGKLFLLAGPRGTFEIRVTKRPQTDGAVLEQIAKTMQAQ